MVEKLQKLMWIVPKYMDLEREGSSVFRLSCTASRKQHEETCRYISSRASVGVAGE